MSSAIAFLRSHLVLPAAVMSAAAALVLLVRVRATGDLGLVFLGFNLVLAWTPFVVSAAMAALDGTRARAANVSLGVLWLLLLPNAPYLVTDLVHLHERPPVPMWYDIALFTLFAGAGLVLAVGSVSHVQRLVARAWGPHAGSLVAVAAIGASGVGIWLGRFLRFNSWDAVFHPQALARHALPALAHPQAIGVSALYGGVFCACWLAYATSRKETA